MRARAPGKLVLSGAYSVLEGAPAVVSAVDRYVYADSEKPAERLTPEVQAALGGVPAPYFDPAELRALGRKLGLGSSAAILVASLACITPAVGGPEPDLALRRAIFQRALHAHRVAQGGGSGIDVAASTWGGTLIAVRRAEELQIEEVRLPTGVVVETWSSGHEASTPELIGRVRRLRSEQPQSYAVLMDPLREHAERTAGALRRGDAAEWLAGLNAQRVGLDRLGKAAGAPIITAAVSRLAEAVAGETGAVLPSGAGGGDVVLWFGLGPSSAAFRAAAQALGHEPLALSLHATGVQQLDGATQRGS